MAWDIFAEQPKAASSLFELFNNRCVATVCLFSADDNRRYLGFDTKTSTKAVEAVLTMSSMNCTAWGQSQTHPIVATRHQHSLCSCCSHNHSHTPQRHLFDLRWGVLDELLALRVLLHSVLHAVRKVHMASIALVASIALKGSRRGDGTHAGEATDLSANFIQRYRNPLRRALVPTGDQRQQLDSGAVAEPSRVGTRSGESAGRKRSSAGQPEGPTCTMGTSLPAALATF